MTPFQTKSRRSDSFGKRASLALFGLVFLALGLVFLGITAAALWATVDVLFWKEVEARVVTSQLRSSESGGAPYTAAIHFTYVYDGIQYDSHRIAPTLTEFRDYREAAEVVAKYPPGHVTTCLVNPDEPSVAVLERGNVLVAGFGLIPVAFVIFGAFMIWQAVVVNRRRALSDSKEAAKGSKGRRTTGLLVGGILALIGSCFLVFWIIPMIYTGWSSRDWIETPCLVESSIVREHPGDDGTTYSVDIRYSYTMEGVTYRSNRYDVLGSSSSNYAGKAAIVEAYPPGSETVCWVNPQNPRDAVLKPGIGLLAIAISLVPATVTLAGIGIAVSSLRRKVTIAESLASGGESLIASGQWSSTSEPRILEPTASRTTRVLVAIGLAIFWNAIVSIFVWQAFEMWQSGVPDWMLTIFLVPFVLIGIGLIGAVFYQLAVLLNPRCQMTITPGTIEIGHPFTLNWTLIGAVDRLRGLVIYLEGTEEASYSRGTTRHTDKHVFARIPILQESAGVSLYQGEAKASVPAGAVPTFVAPSNSIKWAIRVHGPINYWPDLGEDYEIEVLPPITRTP